MVYIIGMERCPCKVLEFHCHKSGNPDGGTAVTPREGNILCLLSLTGKCPQLWRGVEASRGWRVAMFPRMNAVRVSGSLTQLLSVSSFALAHFCLITCQLLRHSSDPV